jgi:hypothetical protein
VESEKADKEKLARYSLLSGHFAGSGCVRTISTATEIEQMGV